MRFTLHQLEVFQAVARCGTFSKAAEQLFLDQSTVSIHIRQLEKAVGVELITFANKKLEITEAGAAMLRAAQRIASIVASTEEELSQLRGGVRGRLRVGVRWMILSHLLSPVIQELQIRLPNVEFELVTGPSVHFAKMLATRELDLAITQNPPSKSSLTITPYFFDRWLLVVRPEVLRADPELTHTPFSARSGDTSSRKEIDHWLQQEGLAFCEIIERRNLQQVKDDVLRDGMIGVLSRCTIAAELDSGALVIAREPESQRAPARTFYFIYSGESTPPLLQHFIDTCMELLPASLRS